MRVVTDIQELSRQKYGVYLDEEFAFALYKGELSSYHLKKGEPIGDKEYEQICSKLLPKRAKKRCMNLLKSRAYTEKRLRDKLKEGGYSSECIDEAIEYVKSFGYINDYEYACQYILFHKEGETRSRLAEKLKFRGISGEVLERAFADVYEDGEEEKLHLMQAQRYLEKKGYSGGEADWKEKQRMFAFLRRKGIPAEIIRRVMEVREWDEVTVQYGTNHSADWC